MNTNWDYVETLPDRPGRWFLVKRRDFEEVLENLIKALLDATGRE